MFLDFSTPKNKGIVIILFASYLTSLISKGIVIEKINKKSDINWQKVFLSIIAAFSITNSIIALTDQTKEIMNILAKGILLNTKGYKTEITAKNKMIN